jgi:hypothetical protein
MADGASLSALAAQRFTSAQIAEALGLHKASAERRALRESWRFTEEATRGGQRRLYALVDLPAQVQAALVRKHALQSTVEAPPRSPREKVAPSEARLQSVAARYERAPTAQKAVAIARNAALIAVEHLVRQGAGRMAAREAVVAELRAKGERAASVASLMRWESLVARASRHHWVALLLPEWCGRPSLKDIPADAWDLFKADYLRPSAPSATGCYERLQRIAKARGWPPLPTLRTFERRIARELPHRVLVLARQGEDALMKLYPAQERDHGVFHALEAVNSDGHRFDVFVRFPSGEIGRPTMVGVQDIYSGKLLGWRLGETETAAVARLAFADVIRDFGIPASVYLDNGRAFASKDMTGGLPTRFRFKIKPEDPIGLLPQLGVEVHWVQPYSGQSKPIERAWRDLCDRIAKHPAFEGAYTGNKPDAKPENYGSRAVDWETFNRVVREEIAAHNARQGRKAATCAGRSFDATFAESYSKSVIKRATAEQQRLMLLASDVVTVDRGGSVHIAGNRYWTEALAGHIGKKVVLRFDPENLHAGVGVYSLGGVYIDDAEKKNAVGFADKAAAGEAKRARTQMKRAAKDMLKAERRLSAAQVAAQLPDVQNAELPAPGVIEAVFGRTQLTASAEVQPLQRTGTDDVDHGVLDGFLERLAKQRGLHKEAE